MELESIDVLRYLALAAASGVVAYLACRRICDSLLDLWVVIGAQQVFVVAYAAYCYFEDLLDPEHFAFIVAGLAAFAIGTYVVPRSAAEQRRTPVTLGESQVLALRCVLYAVCVEQAVADVVFVAAKGLPGLGGEGINPAMYAAGFGVVKYLHDANFALLPAIGLLLLVFARDARAFVVAVMFVVYPQLLLEWSKSSLIYVPLFLFTMNRYCAREFGVAVSVSARRIVPLLAPVAVLFVAYKFAMVVAEGYAESVPLALAKRMLNTADSVFMYFQLGGYRIFEGEIGVLSYLLAHVTPYLGITDAAQEFGVLLPQYTLGIGEAGYGPYPPFQVIAHVTMSWGGVVYCFAVGAVLATIRRARVRPALAVPYFVCLYAAPFLSGDSSLFAYYFVCQFFNAPAVLVAGAAFALLRSGVRPAGEATIPASVS